MAWKVSAVAPMAFDHHDYGYGFNVVNERGAAVPLPISSTVMRLTPMKLH
jgi:hypothetical protein